MFNLIEIIKISIFFENPSILLYNVHYKMGYIVNSLRERIEKSWFSYLARGCIPNRYYTTINSYYKTLY